MMSVGNDIEILKIRVGLLICTSISENQGLEKLGSVSNLRKISGPAQLNFFFSTPEFFFQFVTWIFFSGLRYKSSFFFKVES